jgi:hypothetical protein
VGCKVQQQLDSHAKGDPVYELTKQTCRTGCTYPREHFTRWLTDNGFTIYGLKNTNGIGNPTTAYELHCWLQAQGAMIVKKD